MPNEFENQRILAIRDTCKVCGGEGFTMQANSDGTVTLIDCVCIQVMAWQYKLLNSNIPKRYIEWDISKIYPEFIEDNAESYDYIVKYIEQLHDNIANGSSFWLASTPGLGKSSIISYILRTSLELNYNAYFAKAAELQSLKFSALSDEDSREKIDYIVNDVHILGLEELEKVYLTHDTAMPNYLFYQLISDLYDAKKAILISTNTPRDAVLASLPSYIADRLSTVEYMILHGKSGRRK